MAYPCQSRLPDREEAGTPNILGAIQAEAALRALMQIGMQRLWDHEFELTQKLIDGLTEISGVSVYGDTDLERTPRAGVVSFNIEGILHPLASHALSDYFNIATRNGCFCARPYVRRLLGIPEGEEAVVDGMVRASLGIYTVEEDIERLLAAVRWLATHQGRINSEYFTDDHREVHRNDGWVVAPENYLPWQHLGLGDL